MKSSDALATALFFELTVKGVKDITYQKKDPKKTSDWICFTIDRNSNL